MAKSEPTAQPTVVEYVVRNGKQGVFSHASQAIAQHVLNEKAAEAFRSGAEANFTLTERTVTYEPLGEDHPQYEKDNPAKVPTGEAAIYHPGVVKERKIS